MSENQFVFCGTDRTDERFAGVERKDEVHQEVDNFQVAMNEKLQPQTSLNAIMAESPVLGG